MEYGEQSVMMDGMTRMHKLSVINFSFTSKNNGSAVAQW